MNKHTIVMRSPDGYLFESYIISESNARDLKKEDIPGLVSIIETKKVKHPSPAVLQAALELLGVDADNFYNVCEELKETGGIKSESANDCIEHMTPAIEYESEITTLDIKHDDQGNMIC